MNAFQRLILSGALIFSAAASTHGESQLPEALGLTNITVLGNSDTRFSAPVHRPTAYKGVVKTVAENIITVEGTPRWPGKPQQKWVYAAGRQTNTYYVEFITGNRKGMYYTIVGNTAASLTLELAGDTIAGEGGVVPGDQFKIIPYWSLKTIFASQQGISGTNNIQGTDAPTQILVTDASASGIDLDPTGVYFYYKGKAFNGPGWRRVGGKSTQIRNNDIIPPDTHIIIRQGNVPTVRITLCGVAPLNERKYIIGTAADGTAQDNALAIDMPAALSLRQSNLYQSGAFTGTSTWNATSGDLLLIFDDAKTGFDKLPSGVYFYYTGTDSGGPGWRELNSDHELICDDRVVFKPGSGCIIRKQASPTPVTFLWPVPLPY